MKWMEKESGNPVVLNCAGVTASELDESFVTLSGERSLR